MHTKICPICNNIFVTRRIHQVYCSPECKKKACSEKQNRRLRERWHTDLEFRKKQLEYCRQWQRQNPERVRMYHKRSGCRKLNKVMNELNLPMSIRRAIVFDGEILNAELLARGIKVSK